MKKFNFQIVGVQKKQFTPAGLTIVELLVVMAIFGILIAIPTISLVNVKHKTNMTSVVNSFIADLKEQQLKAMVGDTEGRGTTDNYGIYFNGNQYTLFHGTGPQGNSSDFVITLSDTIKFTNITFPSAKLIFLKGSGEVSGYSNTTNTVTLIDTVDNNQHTVSVNRYGVITSE